MRKIRAHTTWLISLVLRLTGWRFDKSWRHAERGAKRFVYERVCYTFAANRMADGESFWRHWRHYL